MRYLFSLLLSLCLSSPAWAGTPTYDAASNSGNKPNESSTSSYSHTAGTLTNGIAIIAVTSQDSTPGVISGVTYGGSAATQCPTNSPVTVATNNAVSLWYYKSPPAGASAVVATFKVGEVLEVMNSHVVSTVTYANVNQTDPIGTCASAGNFDTVAPSEARVTVTSAVGEVVAAIALFASSTTNTPTTSQNSRAVVLTSGTKSHCHIDAAGAATVNMSCADAGSIENAIIGVSLKPSVDGRARQPILFQ